MATNLNPIPKTSPTKIFNIKPFIFFSVIMVLKSYIIWMTLFDDMFPWEPLVKEIPFIMILFCLIEKFAKKHKVAWYWAANLLISIIFYAIIMYYKHFGIIPTYVALTQIGQVGEVKNSVFYMFAPYHTLIFIDLIIIFIWYLKKWNSPVVQQINSKKMDTVKTATIFVLSIAITLFNIVPNQACVNEYKKTEQMGILGYETYRLLAAAKEKRELIDMENINQAVINELKGIEEVKNPEFWAAAQGKNLIIIQLESLQDFLINLKIDGQEITPNINKLAKSGFYFSNFYEQIGRGNTSDAEFVVNTSLYVDSIEPACHEFTHKDLPSLPKLLKKHGYYTTTFHTNTVHFWNRLALYTALGFDKYYDDQFFGEEDIVSFAASDEVLYTKTAEELKKLNETKSPFYAQVISMSGHHPYIIPDEKILIKLPKKYQNNLVGNYLAAQYYADYALGQFIEALKENGVWDDSIIILYGDHKGLSLSSLSSYESELMDEIMGGTYRQVDVNNIPLIIIGEGITYPKEFTHLGGQVDILPTVANLLGISLDDYLHFGQDLLNQKNTNLLPQRYYHPTGTFFNTEGLFRPGEDFEDGTLEPFDIYNKNAKATKEEYDRALQLLLLSDSYIAQLPDLPDQNSE